MDANSQETMSKRSCSDRSAKLLKKRLPITRWLPKYTQEDVVSDIIAGVTVGLTVVPQSLAYAGIAGLDPQYGLYSSYLGVLIYVLLGSTKQCTIGPTAVMGILTFQTCGENYPQCAILTGFYSGIFELIMAALQLGWVVSFISEPVTVGFTSGASITILSSQIKAFFGLTGEKGSDFLTYWKAIFKDFNTIHAGDAILGVSCFIALMLLRKLKDVNHKNNVVKKAFWLISLSRNVLIIVFTSVLAYIWNEPPFKIVGHVQSGFPSIGPPQFELSHKPIKVNETFVEPDEYYSFWETWSVLKTGPLVIALISVLQNVAISKAFGAGQAVDATQEMLALGTASTVGGFFSSIPISASFSRSAVNEASGVRSSLAGLYTGILVLLSLSFLTPSFYYIPKSALAAVIISAVMFMIDYEKVLPMWKISRIDCISAILTLVSCLIFSMEIGICVGIIISISGILVKSLRPQITTEKKVDPDTDVEYILLTPEAGLYFPSVDHISTTVQKLSLKNKECSLFIMDFAKWTACDYTAAITLICLVKGMKKNDKVLGFINCSEVWVHNFKIGGLNDPPVIADVKVISSFIRTKLKVTGDKAGGSSGRGSMDSVIIGLKGKGEEVHVINKNTGGMMEGIGAISMCSSGSNAEVSSLASSTKPIV